MAGSEMMFTPKTEDLGTHLEDNQELFYQPKHAQ